MEATFCNEQMQRAGAEVIRVALNRRGYPMLSEHLPDQCDLARRVYEAMVEKLPRISIGETTTPETKALQFILNLAREEYPRTTVGTGVEVVLRHIIRRAEEALKS
jgi:hypothetical protein